MPATVNKPVPWRDREFVSIGECAQILARSPDWVRERLHMGDLRGYRICKGAPMVVGVWSVQALIDRAEPVAPRPSRASPLYLAVDNTA
jgi:hypothetical protein